ncbi:hypothetical protein C8J57DRAFT_1238558 [Mycena rebaudengoi]|nr:hypothetical protein C8J57DRAFT_1238558 [Mycena rebaudengoi]
MAVASSRGAVWISPSISPQSRSGVIILVPSFSRPRRVLGILRGIYLKGHIEAPHLPQSHPSGTLLSSLRQRVSLRVIVDILVCLHSLSAFQLEGQSCSIIEAEISPSQPCPPCLQTLEIAVKDGADTLFAWFLSLAVGPQIKSLTLLEDWDNNPTAQSLVAYFQRFGHRLEFLAIWPRRASFNRPSGMLKHATSLRHLKLHCLPVSSVLTMLSALPSSNLFTLAIELDVDLDEGRVDTISNIDRIPYALIDEALAHPRFLSLRSFSLGEYSVRTHPDPCSPGKPRP